MTSIVVNASTLIEMLAGPRPRARMLSARLAGAGLVAAPAMVTAEIAAGLRRMVRQRVVGEQRGRLALAEACHLRIFTYPFEPFGMRVWALRDRVSTYDAWYVALAEALAAPLLT